MWEWHQRDGQGLSPAIPELIPELLPWQCPESLWGLLSGISRAVSWGREVAPAAHCAPFSLTLLGFCVGYLCEIPVFQVPWGGAGFLSAPQEGPESWSQAQGCVHTEHPVHVTSSGQHGDKLNQKPLLANPVPVSSSISHSCPCPMLLF